MTTRCFPCRDDAMNQAFTTGDDTMKATAETFVVQYSTVSRTVNRKRCLITRPDIVFASIPVTPFAAVVRAGNRLPLIDANSVRNSLPGICPVQTKGPKSRYQFGDRRRNKGPPHIDLRVRSW